jgi:Linalool dehydratase/isomerase
MVTRAAQPPRAGNLLGDLGAVLRIPAVPRWGDVRRRYLLRSAVLAAVVVIAAFVLIFAVDTSYSRAAGISLIVPGGGFLFDAWPILFVATWCAWWIAWNFWIGFGSIFHLGVVYLAQLAGGIALAEGPRLGVSPGTNWEWAIPVLLIAAALYVVSHLVRWELGYRQAVKTREERNAYLATIPESVKARVLASFDAPEVRHAAHPFDPLELVDGQSPLPVSDADAALAKWLLKISIQPIDSFDGWDWRPGPFEDSALRYQINEIGYALAYLQANYVPAYPSLYGLAQRNVIEKAQNRKAWGYWFLENFWGNLRFNPDPIKGAKLQNIMFSGFFAKHLAHYEAATHDHRYDEPGSLTFVWKDGRTFDYSYKEIAEHCSRGFAESPLTLWPCEPNQVYMVCNQMGAAGVQGFDALHGTDYWGSVQDRYRSALDHEWMKPNGDYYGHYNTRLGMNVGALTWNDGTSPMFMDGNGALMGQGRTMAPEVASRLFLLGRAHESWSRLPIENGRMRLPKPSGPRQRKGLFDIGYWRWRMPSPQAFLSGAWVDLTEGGCWPMDSHSNAQIYAGVADTARQYGNDELADAAIRGLDADNFLGMDAERPFRSRLSTLATICKARWGRLYKQDDFLSARIPKYEGPILASAPYPDVLVTYANGRDDQLCLTLEPVNGAGAFPLTFERLRPDARYVIESNGAAFTTSAEGTGTATIDLNGRITTIVRPA